MKNLFLAVSTLLLLSFACNPIKKPVDYVNPFIDTHKSRWFYFASAARPFGMVSLSPDTWILGSWRSGYMYDSMYVRCFSHVHSWQMSGIPVMPTIGKVKGNLGMEATKSSFSHETEIAKPGYHKIVLDDYNIKVELTSTTRVGFHKYTFPKTDSALINFFTGEYLAHGDVDSSYIRKVNNHEIEGFSIMSATQRRPKHAYVYFVARTNVDFKEFGGWKSGKILHADSVIEGKRSGSYLRFETDGKPVLMKVALSYTSMENARKNLETELPDWDFDKTVASSQKEWNDLLSRIKITGGTDKQKIKFYTDLWHSLLGRHIVSDVDGKYCDMTGEKPVIRQTDLNEQGKPVFPHYNFDGFWGSQWTVNTLWSMVYPEIMDGLCKTMVDMYKYSGLIPRGPSGGNYTYVMIGDPEAPFIACAYNKGIRGYDTNLAYEGLLKNAYPGGIRDRAGYDFSDNPTGGGMTYYIERGYVPEGLKGGGGHKDGAAMTLEYAYQDWCIAQIAEAMGKKDDYNKFMQRSENYRNLWDPEIKLMHPRNNDGSWIKDFSAVADKFNTIGFCESNSAIYTNFVPHNIPGLIDLFGGNEEYNAFLMSSFNKALRNHFVSPPKQGAKSWVDYGNQPSCQMAHLFNFSGAPWLTQKYVRMVKEITFGDVTPYGGYHGDEDQGQMGALGVLMAMGVFQMDGGTSINSAYEITSPLFDKIEIALNHNYYKGKKFIIETKNNSAENIYIQSAKLNGEDWNKCFFRHNDYAQGGKLEITLGKEPNKSWGNRNE